MPAIRPELSWLDEGGISKDIRVICQMEEDPPGLVPWLIVRTHRYSVGIHWQKGLLLNAGVHGSALLEQRGLELSIIVRAEYPSHLMSVLIDIVTHMIGQRWPGLDYWFAAPCPRVFEDGPCPGRLKMEVLRKRRVRNQLRISCPDCGDDVEIDKLLTGLEAPRINLRQRLTALRALLEQASEERRRFASHAAEMTRLLLNSISTETKEGPRLFTLVPKDINALRAGGVRVGTIPYILTLWCEYPGGEHPLCDIASGGEGEYVITVPSEWLAKVAPYASLIARTLRTLVPIAGAAIDAAIGSQLSDSSMKFLDLMATVTDRLLEGRLEQGQVAPGGEQRITQAEGAGLRELHALLSEIDPLRHWGGLRQSIAPSGDFLWLCPTHYRIYDPGLPKL